MIDQFVPGKRTLRKSVQKHQHGSIVWAGYPAFEFNAMGQGDLLDCGHGVTVPGR
jgi:hypothetical protein